MFNKLKRMYLAGRLNEFMLGNAVKKGWISEEQKLEIIQAKINADKNLSEDEVLDKLTSEP